MKKLIIIAAALLCLASCAKVEKQQTVESSAISFKVVNYLQQTKAPTAYTGDAFGVFAYWTATDWATDGDANRYMTNDKVVQSPDYAPEGEWGPVSARYWTKTGKLTFAAYSPYTDGAGQGFSAVPSFSKAKGFEFKDFTISANSNVDLMVADLAKDKTKNDPEYMVSGNKDGVPILFRHVLSRIAFRFATVENPNPNVEDTQIIIHSVTIKGIKDNGDYTQNNDPVWAGQTGNASYDFNPATGGDITVNPGDEGQGTDVDSRILLPQTLTEGGQQIEISYTIRTKYESNPEWAEEDVTATADLVTDEVPSWDPNMSLVYTITIDPVSKDPILFDPAVAEWESVATGALTL
ncbi:MAG: fimbrillin family protein [Bacteroidales bacterium]|nr:fimbrillin family protein [Bacteroidales bacterium]